MHSPLLEGPGMMWYCDQVVIGTSGQARALRAWKESVNMCEIISFWAKCVKCKWRVSHVTCGHMRARLWPAPAAEVGAQRGCKTVTCREHQPRGGDLCVHTWDLLDPDPRVGIVDNATTGTPGTQIPQSSPTPPTQLLPHSPQDRRPSSHTCDPLALGYKRVGGWSLMTHDSIPQPY